MPMKPRTISGIPVPAAAVACAFDLATKLPGNFFKNQMWAEGSEGILGGVSKTALTFALTTMYSREELCRLGESLAPM